MDEFERRITSPSGFLEINHQLTLNQLRPSINTLLGIAISRWSQKQRQALTLLLSGQARYIEDFIPGIWDRPAKAKQALRELEKARHLVREDGRWLLLESSFAPELLQASRTQHLALPEVPGLNSALAEGARVQAERLVSDETLRPSQDVRGVPSGTGPPLTLTPAAVCVASVERQDRSSRSMDERSVDLDDRSRPARDAAAQSDCLELLALKPRLEGLRRELLARKTPTARRFWQLHSQRPREALQKLQDAAEARFPPGYLNKCLQLALPECK